MTKPAIPEKYRFFKALRPFSLSVAVVTCGLGISLALADGIFHPFRAVVVLVAGLLLQSAVNLFNDYADLAHLHCSEDISTGLAVKAIYRNTAVAVVMTVVACLLGLYLIMFAGWPLFWVGLAGIAGGYFYTGAPIAYKNRGLGIIGVFYIYRSFDGWRRVSCCRWQLVCKSIFVINSSQLDIKYVVVGE